MVTLEDVFYLVNTNNKKHGLKINDVNLSFKLSLENINFVLFYMDNERIEQIVSILN